MDVSNDSILVVDDTPVNLKLVSALLSKQGFQVRTAATAEEALQLTRKFHPRLVLADIQLPGMDGLELARQLKADPATRETLVIALTAFATENDEQEVLKAGCDGYMTKPIDARTFPAVIRRYLTPGSVAPKSLPQPRLQTNEGFSPEELHQSCLTAGLAESWRVMELLEEGFRRAAALATHRWVGLGGSIGYPEIRQLARELETVLQQETPASSDEARNILTRLARLFAQKMGQADRHALPAGLKANPAETSIPVDSAQALRVLIADQDFTVTALVQSAMRNWGFCCRVAQNINDALEIIPTWKPHAVLMDLNLLDSNDPETLTSLRNELARNSTKIVMLASDQQESDMVQSFQLGAADYLLKPFTPIDLLARLKKLLTS